MGMLSDDLSNMGFVPTGRESPVDDIGELWTNGHEIVCDESGIVIDGNHFADEDDDDGEEVYRYYNSKRVRMPGGYVSSYDWGSDDEHHFRY